MARRPKILLASLLFCLACNGGPETAPESSLRLAGGAKGWNVVFLTVDTLRADRLGAYGYTGWPNHPNSPKLDAQLSSGVLFERAQAQRSETWPSLASLLTGLYPRGHGVVENGYGFPDGLPTLPKLLHAAGYQTGAFLSNMCKANHQGWDAFNCSGGRDGKAVQGALEWAGKLEGEKPFFLWVHLFGAHSPYYNGGDLASRELDPGYEGPLGTKKWQLNRVMTEKLPLSERDVRQLDALYDAAVMGSDRLAGSLLDGLRSTGRLERTLLVISADHGEELYDHNGYLYHACSVYQTGLHVPLGIAAPGLIPAGARVLQVVELIDVMPTVLSLLGLAAPVEQHGRSLVPYLEGKDSPARPAFSEYGSAPLQTVVEDRWKLVYNPEGFQPICIPDAPPGHYPIGQSELYDLAQDPGETRNLAAGQPDRVAELARLIRQRFAGVKSRVREQEVS
ncbi:MAG TPA: sulfatase, partial [Thermoanaerobaculia bacterium]|nr:sulfatase [Thermoanaerobaculia bacterium]